MGDLAAGLTIYGPLGILLVLALGAIYYLYKEIKEIQQKRIDELKQINTELADPVRSVKQTVETILSFLTTPRKRTR
jgi:hypothetical protein